MVREETRITDALGFPLKVKVSIGDHASLGCHRVSMDYETGLVAAEAEHRIEIQSGQSPSELTDTVSHEVYHMFCSIRHLITADEETQAEVFGQLVRYVCEACNDNADFEAMVQKGTKAWADVPDGWLEELRG
jgi:hypothetical protein